MSSAAYVWAWYCQYIFDGLAFPLITVEIVKASHNSLEVFIKKYGKHPLGRDLSHGVVAAVDGGSNGSYRGMSMKNTNFINHC